MMENPTKVPARNDGMLTAQEAMSLDLWGTEVVALSACDTGFGEVRTGQGVFGLRRALFLAGSKTQVMTLWQVADEPTKNLMVSWYAQLAQGVPRAEAMRNVQLAAIRGQPLPVTQTPLRGAVRLPSARSAADSRHPYYWAAFILSGEPGPLSLRR